MLNRAVLGVSAIAIAIVVMFLTLRFCGGDESAAETPRSATPLVDTMLTVPPGGADAASFMLINEAIVEVSAKSSDTASFFDAYVMSEADWKRVAIPGGLPSFTIRNVAASTLRGNVPAGRWRVVIHDAHGAKGLQVHVRAIETR